MKLYNYYKLEENKFCRLVSSNDNIKDYELVYCFSEKEEQPEIPDNFKKNNNVIYGGTGFTHNRYVPFKNNIIDYTLPSTAIYKNFLKEKYNNGVSYKIIDKFLDNTYYRMHAGSQKLPIPPVRKNKQVYIYDIDFFNDDWEELIIDIVNHNPSAIYTIHPIICETMTQYFSIRNIAKISRMNPIILDITIPYDEIPYLLKKYKNLLLADIARSSDIYISIGGDKPGKYAYYHELIYKLNLLYSLWAAGIPMKICYIRPHFGFTNPFPELSMAVAMWSRRVAQKDYPHTLNDKIIFKSKKIQIERDQAKELIAKYPEAKDLFTQTFEDLAKRRYWKI